MFYFICLLVLICLAYFFISLCNISKNKKDNVFLLVSFILCVLFIGFRADVTSPDTYTYVMAYKIIGTEYFNMFDFEIGYFLFNKFIYMLFGDNRILFLSSCAFLSCLPIFIFIKQHDTNKLLSVIVWCVFNGMNTAVGNIRQSIAIGIILLSYYFIANKKFIFASILILLSSTFHLSAIFLLIIFLLYFVSTKIRLSIRNLMLFLPIFILIFIFSDSIFIFLLDNTVNSYYSYLTDLRQNVLGSYIYTIVTSLIFGFSLFIYKKNAYKLSVQQFKELTFYLYILLLGILFYAISSKNGTNRVALYFVSVYVFIIPMSLKLVSNDKAIKIILSIFFFLCLCGVVSGMFFLPSSFLIGKYKPVFC
ncbi:EpsG family protein [Candidatus Ruminimicrobiellum ovillum]|uniref:EpsG family protein n=1 Tax=Candidatus Ruminimicrobiellum ovillum TaxID=1947927 RepID=UPI00355A2DBE